MMNLIWLNSNSLKQQWVEYTYILRIIITILYLPMQNEFGRIFPITLEIGNNFVYCDKHVKSYSREV